MFPPSQPGADEPPTSKAGEAELTRTDWSRRASSIGAWSSSRALTILVWRCQLEVVKISPKSGSSTEPAPH